MAVAAPTRTPPGDLRNLPHSRRHSVVFDRLQALEPGAAIEVVCEYEPRLLRRQVETYWPGTFDWAWDERGPVRWAAAITRRG
jgi:uncharacterized protein (DUF2249 family)